MAHLHSVYDTDAHFSIDPITRTIKNEGSTKNTLVQKDHNAERFTFELPKNVDGHDMSLCNLVEVHYINIDKQTKEKSVGVYVCDDFDISPNGEDVVICSWLISGNATKYEGTLQFVLRFACLTDDVIDYQWFTAIHSGINVSSGIFNSEYVAEEYADILAQWKAEIDAMIVANTEARHEHENKPTLDALSCENDEHPNDPFYFPTGLYPARLKHHTSYLRYMEDGAVIHSHSEVEIDGKQYMRLILDTKDGFEELDIPLENPSDDITGITPEQTTFFEFAPSNNLLDFSTKQVGLLNNDGRIYTGGSYDNYRYFEQYIPVNAGDEISLQYTYNGTRYNYSVTGNVAIFSRVAAYDSNKQILKTLGAITNSTNKVTVYTVPETVAYIRISLSNNCDGWTDIAVVKNTSVVLPYEEYGTNSKVQLKSEYIPEKKNTILAFMPDEIICATGRTIEIYNKQVCPLAEQYHFRWVCDIGKALKRKFSITGTEDLIGDYDLILKIYDDTETCLYSKTSKLKIVTGTIADNVSICPIGDSLTNGKHWLNEVRTLSENKVSYVGTRGNTEGVKHEGRSGFTSKGYLTAQTYDFENEGVHPFWDGSKFSWSHYKTNSGINPSAVQIFLGTNDLFGNTTAETFSGNIKTMVDDIRSTDANIPIFVVMTILTGNQNGLGKQQSTDGFASYKGKYKYALDCKFIKAMNLLYDTLKDYSNLYFVPLTECHDNEYNFGAVETPVNPRATQTEYMPNEGIHPQQQGYEQMADVMYSVYCRAFVSQ